MCFKRQNVLGKQLNKLNNFLKTLLSGKMWNKNFENEVRVDLEVTML